ncbi:MAG: metallophosphoesterase [Rhodothermales bacterium]|nr:metallophosphoesterase [Rhodothermales bacterium]
MTAARTAGAVLGGGALAAAALAAYAFLVEPRWIEVTHTRVGVPCLPAGRRVRLALLTDLHAGAGTPLSLVRRACAAAMDAHPDAIALTGDFVSGARDDADLGRLMHLLDDALDAPLGVFAVPGNHDHEAGVARWHHHLRTCPRLTDLTNRAERRTVEGCRLWIAGVDSLTRGTPREERALPPPEAEDVTVLLAHNPDHAEAASEHLGPVNLVVSGHTHGGQVRLPFAGALVNPSRHEALYEDGLTHRPWAAVYVSRGIGTVHLPVRFRCRPEVAILDLEGV